MQHRPLQLNDLRQAKHITYLMMRYEYKHFRHVNPHHYRFSAFCDRQICDRQMSAILHKYDENQARDKFGRWTNGGSNDVVEGGSGQPIPLADRYRINLIEEEGGPYNGHTLQKHVGRNPQTMHAEHAASARVEIDPKTGVQELIRPRGESTFTDTINANLYVNDVLLRNANEVDKVASGAYSTNRAFTENFPTPTGWQSYSDDPSDVPILRQVNNVRVVIRHDPFHPRGYRLITAFPIN